MSFSQLAPDWQDWLMLNVKRQCDGRSLITDLTERGGFSREVSEQALAEARRRLIVVAGVGEPPAPQPRPSPDCRGNIIDAGDRSVDVLMAVDIPRIVLLRNVLSDEECDALVAEAEARMERSTVVDDTTGITTLNAHRTSSGAFFQRGESPLVTAVEQRLARIARWPVERGEGLQVLRYAPGGEYRPHFDWFDPALPGPRRHLSVGGQRVGTFVMYLADVEAGGGTGFPELGLEVRPQKGSAVFFANVDAFGRPDRKTLHAGQVVAKGVKYIATKWLREAEYGASS